MRIKVCDRCGGEDVVVDAYARWNPYKNDFELDAVFEYCYCNECEEECDLEDKEVEDETEENSD